ncbi:hypothetical protein E1218_15560 [Kribbella turkmenica]|uniref:Uncharacterized protein n=1 Tax=Kribbella turkmenica TaxID=2530375 RepID=A0A4R4X408_9ACTN|nr:hypothetical protein [Kribbella turkmenica]TDD25028.1 hypothetical protein E1218_15560 [Kribbella turkmenica]
MLERPEELHLFEPGTLTVAPHVAEEIPDVGAYFLDWAAAGLNPGQTREVEAAINGRRCQNGWFPLDSLDNIGSRGFWRGPLTYLARMTADDASIVQDWASSRLDGEKRRRIEATANHLLFRRGHAAAATWVVAVRPQAYLDLAELGERLAAAWELNLGSIRPKDVAKAVRRWNR